MYHATIIPRVFVYFGMKSCRISIIDGMNGPKSSTRKEPRLRGARFPPRRPLKDSWVLLGFVLVCSDLVGSLGALGL